MFNRSFGRVLGLAAVATALGCTHGVAQSAVDGALRGRVLDARGVPAEHVRLRLRAVDDTGSGVEADAASGVFFLLRLEPGEYVVEAESASAVGTARAVVELVPGGIADVTLRLGTAVQGAALERPRGLELLRAELTSLPSRSREWEALGELDPLAHDATPASADERGAANGDPSDAENARGAAAESAPAEGLSYDGLPATQNAQVVDGLTAMQNFRSGPRGSAQGGPSSGASFAEGAVRSLRVLPRTFSAQYGAAAGGVVAVVSRAGADRMHGSAFVLERESAWAAGNPFSVVTHYSNGAVTSAPAKPSGSMLNFGGAVGFPLWHAAKASGGARSRASAFVSVDAQLRDDHVISTPALASFYALTPTHTALLANRGVSAGAVNAALNFLDSLSGTTARRAYRVMPFMRVDFAPSGRDQATVAYIGHRFRSPAGAALGQASDAVVSRGTGSLGDSAIGIDAFTARWLHVFGARAANDARFQFARDLEYETPHAPLAQEPATGPGGFAPQVSIGPNGFAYGTPAGLGRFAYPDEQRVEVADAFELRAGLHLLRVGGSWSRVDDRLDTLTNGEGSFSYNSGTTGGHAGGLVDWITDFTFNANAYPNGGCPSIYAAIHVFCFHSFTQSFGPTQTEFVTHELAGFAEDSFRVRDDLVVTVGARYEYVLLPVPQRQNVVLDAAIAGLGGRIGGATAKFPEDRNNVGPRVAATWAPRWRGRREPLLTAHVGYGAFFGRVPGATVAAALNDTALPTSFTHIRITPQTITNCPQVTTGNQGFGYPCDYTSAPPAAVTQTTYAMVFARSFRAAAIQRATLSVERSFGKRAFVRAGYVTAMATQLPTSVDLNIAPSATVETFLLQGGDGRAGVRSGETFVVPMYGSRVVPQYGPVTAIVSNANATYHAATVEAEWRAGAFEVRGGYTFSRAIDYGPQQGARPGVNSQFDPFRDGYDKGLSSLQFPQRFTSSLIYTTVKKKNDALGRVLADWRVSAIATASSGAPYSYAIYGGSYLSGGLDTINGSGGATYLPTVGRNTLRLPPRGKVDARLARSFRVRDRWRLEAFAQVFNVLNTRNLSRVETRAFLVGTPATTGAPTPLVYQNAATVAAEGLNTPAFGTPLSSTSGLSRERQVEMGMHLTF